MKKLFFFAMLCVNSIVLVDDFIQSDKIYPEQQVQAPIQKQVQAPIQKSIQSPIQKSIIQKLERPRTFRERRQARLRNRLLR